MDIEYVNYVGLSKVIIFIIMKERIKTNNALLLKDVVCVDMKDLVNQSMNRYTIEKAMLFLKFVEIVILK